MHPSFTMVYVEGATRLVRNYKRLMLHRIQWTEAARARGEEEVELAEDENGGGNSEGAGAGASAVASTSKDELQNSSDSLADNRCDIVWEGQIRERVFKSFKPKSCPTDAAAKEALGEKMAGYWDQTKNWKPEEEELF
jgi:U4/U6 small nuclear ribonucleoprotein PRP3